MKEVIQRSLLYGGAIAVLVGLGFAISNSKTDADVNTLLGSVDVQLRLAYGIPAVDKQGNELTSRTQMIVDAEKYLDTIDRIQPDMAVATEFRGFAHMLRGQYVEAAAAYGRARQCKDCTQEQGDVLAFNQARMLARAGEGEKALSVFQQNRKAEAERSIDAVVAAAAVEPMAWLQAGREYEQLGRTEKAETAYLTASGNVPIADYHLARLKLEQGDVDKSLELLGRAVAAVPAEVRRLVQEEPDAWRAVQANARFQELTVPRAATPGR